MIKLIYPDEHEVDHYVVGISNDIIDFYSGRDVVATVVKMPGLLVVDDGEEETK